MTEFTINRRDCAEPLTPEMAAAKGSIVQKVYEQMSQQIEIGQTWTWPRTGEEFMVTSYVVGENGGSVGFYPKAAPNKSLHLGESQFRARYKLKGAPPEPPPSPAEFRVGDAVRLAGGSPNDPIMTVTAILWDDDDARSNSNRKQDAIEVAYVPVYGPEGAIRRDRFPAAALRAVGSGTVPRET